MDQNHVVLALFFATFRLGKGRRQGVARLRRRQNAFAPRKRDARLEAFELTVRPGLNQVVLEQLADDHAGAVVAQPARVDGGRDEVVPEGVHGQERGHAHGVAKVVPELPAREFGARGRFARDASDVGAFGQVLAQEGEREPGEVGAAAKRRNHHVRHFPGLFHLLHGLLADHGLVQQDVVQNRAERVFRVRILRGHFHGFADGDSEASRGVGVGSQDALACLGEPRG